MIQTDLSDESLQKLRFISETEHLKHHVQTLLIKRQYDWGYLMGRGFHRHRLGEWDFPSHVVTQLSPGAQMLREVLTKLVNCKSFQIDKPNGVRQLYDSAHLLSRDGIAIAFSIIAETCLPVKSFDIGLRNAGV